MFGNLIVRKRYLKINGERVIEYEVCKSNETQCEIEFVSFAKDMPYIMDLTFYKYGFQKNGEDIKGFTIL